MKIKFSIYTFLGFIILFFSILLLPQKVKASDETLDNNVQINNIAEFSAGDVLITEVEYNPPQSGTDTKYEWVELYNNTDADINLSNWTLSDNTNSDKISTFILKSGEFLVIAATQDGFSANFPNQNPKNFTTIPDGAIGNGLANSGDSVILKDPNPGDLPIDSISWPDKAPLVSDGYSIARIPFDGNFYSQKHPSPGLSPVQLSDATNISFNSYDISWSSYDFPDFSKFQIYKLDEDGNEHLLQEFTDSTMTDFTIQNLNPGTNYQNFIRVINSDGFSADSNIISTKTDFQHSNSVIVNEILPTPSTGSSNEFIELYNSGSDSVNLSGWFLDDSEGGSSPYQIPNGTIISAGQYLVFYKSQTGLSLNDSGGDLARLLWPDNSVISQTPNYGSGERGESWSRAPDGSWKWSTTLTPGEANQITQSTSPTDDTIIYNSVSITDAKKLASGEFVTVIGIVSVSPYTLAKTYFYIQDSTSGVEIYFTNIPNLNLSVGDSIQVSGEISNYQNGKRIKISSLDDIVILSHSPPPNPAIIKIVNADIYEGQLVKIVGVLDRSVGNTFYISDGSGEIRVYVASLTSINKPKMKKGDKVEIIGIVSITPSGYRILPRFQNDIKNKTQSLKNTNQNSSDSLVGEVLGVQKAQAATPNLEIGKDYRVQSSNSSNYLGWIIILVGLFLLIIFLGFSVLRKNN
jgi:DNA/RNA endonuclease YhcR with UshA esterase domain